MKTRNIKNSNEKMKTRNTKKSDFMWNKKAVEFLGGHVVNLVITAIVVVFLIILIVKLYGTFTDKNKLNRVVDQLEKVVQVVNQVNSDSKRRSIEVFPPDKYWVLKTFSRKLYPYGECLGKESCLCICKKGGCDDPKTRKCEGFDFPVAVGGGPNPDPRFDIEVIGLSPIQNLFIDKEERDDVFEIKIRKGK